MSNTVYAGMATIPSRKEHLNEVLSNIAPQVDKLWVASEEPIEVTEAFDNVRELIVGDRTDDARKFAPLWILDEEEPFYFFTLDDDLLYPPNYVEVMTKFIDNYHQEIVVCVHGSWVDEFPIDSYYKDKQAVHFSVGTPKPIQLLFPGTGTVAFHTSAIRPTEGHLPRTNIADVQFAIHAQRTNTPVLAVPRPTLWVQQHPELNGMENSIWADRRNADSEETFLINRFSQEFGWSLPATPT